MPRIGYLLPTRERIMAGAPEVAPMMDLAALAESLGFDSLWIGDSLLARPRHEPITMLAAVAAITSRAELGTAVLLPALRNPVLLAHQVATLDRIAEGRTILGIGIAGDVPNIRAEFESAGVPFDKRIGRLLEGMRLCKALWRGEPVDWDGRWKVTQGVLGPTPHREGGPPIWIGGGVRAGQERAGKYFDGWFPTGPDASGYGEGWDVVKQAAQDSGRADDEVTAAVYLTVSIDDDAKQADDAINAYLENYYGQPAALLRKRQACFAGTADALGGWLEGYVNKGAQHLVIRIVGDHASQLEDIAALRRTLGW